MIDKWGRNQEKFAGIKKVFYVLYVYYWNAKDLKKKNLFPSYEAVGYNEEW